MSLLLLVSDSVSSQVLLLFIISGLVILAHCADACSERTYQEVVRGICGRLTGVLCEILIAVYTFGTCIAFFIIIGDQLEKRECWKRGGSDRTRTMHCVCA